MPLLKTALIVAAGTLVAAAGVLRRFTIASIKSQINASANVTTIRRLPGPMPLLV